MPIKLSDVKGLMVKNNSIYLTISEEGDLSKPFNENDGSINHPQGKVVWVHFIGKDGNAAGLNLNNIVSERGYITKKAMFEAIDKYEYQGSKSIGLNRERLAQIICDIFNGEGNARSGFFSKEIADAIISKEHELIEVKNES